MKKQSSAWIEMLFENRNKEYGAYDLRVNYEKRLFRSFGLALLIAGCFFLVPYVLTQVLTANYLASKSLDGELVYDLSKKYVIEKPMKAESAPASKAKAVSADATYKVVSKIEEKKIPEQKPVDPGNANSLNPGSAAIATGIDSATTDVDWHGTDSMSTETMSIASVDVVPEFPGGEDALMKFMGKNLHYPEEAKENKISGKVYVSFVINEKGRTENISIMHGLGAGTEDEVIRVISLMPAWKPGRYHNREVKTAFVMPVSFSLK